MEILRAALCAAVALTLLAAPARAADYPAPQEADWIAKDFKFHTGEVMPELKLHSVPAGHRGARHQASAARDRKFDGRHA